MSNFTKWFSDIPSRRKQVVDTVVASIFRFRRDRRGNVAMIFGLSVLPIMGLVGAGVDYSKVSAAYSKLNAVADSAALGAIANPNDKTVTPSNREFLGAIGFAQQAKLVEGVTDLSTTLAVTANNSDLTAKAKYTANVPLTFGAFLGKKTVQISKEAIASTVDAPTSGGGGGGGGGSNDPNLKHYVYYFAVDTSESMNIVANKSDIPIMEALSINAALTGGGGGGKCAFACHTTAGTTTALNAIAKAAKLELRIDAARSAVSTTIAKLQETDKNAKVGIYSINEMTKPILDPPVNVTAGVDTLLQKTKLIASDQSNKFSTFDKSLPDLATYIPQSGDGSSADKAKRYAIIVTDGVWGFAYGPGNHPTAAIDPSSCNALKAKGVTVAVIYTEYVPLPNEPDFYTQISQAKINQIEPNLKACASPGQLYKPGNGAQIASFMSDIVTGNAQAAVAAKIPRLVQ